MEAHTVGRKRLCGHQANAGATAGDHADEVLDGEQPLGSEILGCCHSDVCVFCNEKASVLSEFLLFRIFGCWGAGVLGCRGAGEGIVNTGR